jgi:hypothetical protein
MNAYRIRQLINEEKSIGDTVQSEIASAFRQDFIPKARYLEVRNVVRAAITESTRPIPDDMKALIARVKEVDAEHFKARSRYGMELCTNGTALNLGETCPGSTAASK